MSAKNHVDNEKIIPRSVRPEIRRYLADDLGDFYSRAVNRLVLYPFIFTFFLVECPTFWVIYLGPSFFLEYTAFIFIYSLHKAVVYSVCICGADMVAHFLMRPWGTYGGRTVGKQWLIWTLGLAAGFALQRTMVRGLIVTYTPDVISYFTANPQVRMSYFTLLLFLLPYWCFVVFVTLKIAGSMQTGKKQPISGPSEDFSSETGAMNESEIYLQCRGESPEAATAFRDITHVTVEDHYCHIHYKEDNSLRRRMVRQSLKKILGQIPQDAFIKIHRSHAVNINHISRIRKKGRDHKVVMDEFDVELPVSRSCFKGLQSRLKESE